METKLFTSKTEPSQRLTTGEVSGQLLMQKELLGKEMCAQRS